MIEERLYNMLVSPIIEDAIIAANFLIKKSLPEIKTFFDKYGKTVVCINKEFHSEKEIRLKKYHSRLTITKGPTCIIWIGGNGAYLLKNSRYWKKEQFKVWEDVTI